VSAHVIHLQTPEETAELSAKAEARGEEQGPFYETEGSPNG
jgi:hypothetical protein